MRQARDPSCREGQRSFDSRRMVRKRDRRCLIRVEFAAELMRRTTLPGDVRAALHTAAAEAPLASPLGQGIQKAHWVEAHHRNTLFNTTQKDCNSNSHRFGPKHPENVEIDSEPSLITYNFKKPINVNGPTRRRRCLRFAPSSNCAAHRRQLPNRPCTPLARIDETSF